MGPPWPQLPCWLCCDLTPDRPAGGPAAFELLQKQSWSVCDRCTSLQIGLSANLTLGLVSHALSNVSGS